MQLFAEDPAKDRVDILQMIGLLEQAVDALR